MRAARAPDDVDGSSRLEPFAAPVFASVVEQAPKRTRSTLKK